MEDVGGGGVVLSTVRRHSELEKKLAFRHSIITCSRQNTATVVLNFEISSPGIINNDMPQIVHHNRID